MRARTQRRIRMRHPGSRLCTCRTLESLEGKGSLLHLQGECNALHLRYLISRNVRDTLTHLN